MKIFIFSIVALGIISAKTNSYIKSTLIDKDFITLSFYNSASLKQKICSEKSKRYFWLNEKKIYIDVDQKAHWNNDVESLLSINTIQPQFIPDYLPVIYLAFIVDENGKVIYKGMDRDLPEDEYQKEFYRLMTLICEDLEPAIINEIHVASILKIHFDYYSILDAKNSLKK